MRLRAVAFVLAALAGVGLGAWRLGEAATAWVEREILTQSRAGLASAGETWAGVEAAPNPLKDMMTKILSGKANVADATREASGLITEKMAAGR